MTQIETLNNFLCANKLQATCVSLQKTGCVSVFDLKTENKFRVSKLHNLSRELMLTMKFYSPPSFKLDIDRGFLQIEGLASRPNSQSLIESISNTSNIEVGNFLPIKLGKSFDEKNIIMDMSKNPHLLIGGSTGSGKSTLLHNIIANLLLNSAAEIFIVDTKAVEFINYSVISSRVKIIDNIDNFVSLIKYLIFVMEQRYTYIKNNTFINVNNNKVFKPIILLIDEYADLVMQDKYNEGYSLLCQLVQKCRAAGIYCVLATQRPSANIITGLIKANFPARIACKVPSKIDSRIILDQNGAESLNNIGEAIINNYNHNMIKFQTHYSPIGDILHFLNEKMASYN